MLFNKNKKLGQMNENDDEKMMKSIEEQLGYAYSIMD